MKALIGSVAALALLTTSCATIDEASTATDHVSVDNCGAPLQVPVPVTRVVSNDTGVTELLFALGLQDRMAGYFLDSGQDRDISTSPWKAQFESTTNLGQGFTREAVQTARPHLVFAGWNYGFSETSGLTPDWVRSIGAVPYQLTEACRQSGTVRRGIKAPLEALYEDLANLGVIFGVQDRARDLIASYRQTIEDVQSHAPHGQAPVRVFLYDSGEAEPFTSGKTAAPQQIIEKAGGRNIFSDLNDSWTTSAWETAAQRDPQVIIVCDYGVGPNHTARAKIDLLKAQPLMRHTQAVRDENFIVLPYAALVEGPRNPDAIVTLANYLRSKGF
ncbi:Putative iron compound ABC transporter%2C substrate-binding protein [Mycobacteroides abscessus]|uniref:ABC transporter substrate-binding protein n=1 Tax=Mycobacteroides abscessus TaxID=36809 RepID=UPI0005E30391|nr:ABC transporter substrate-binding protein [Mycobacteroides abscessus]CPU52352.1 Putative iron compound ABC transporter%2C substrate-binding protein [Mycobacteroides abscessus]CPX71752.1 Putative iron compound ABC transporter%2C substrate-binding protein [Mycobacteroides abscessus]CPZ77331.1 Putative iron compound ABC transporter%2C substrate-binding protein [Mycobacteroides abscessus]